MAGLLGFDFTPEQQSNLTQGLLGAVGAGLAGRGNARQNIGVGLLGGVNAYQNAQQNNLQEMYRTAMVENQQAQAAERRQKAEMAQRQQSYLGSGGAPSVSQVLANGQGPTVANAQAMNRPAGYTLPGLLSVGVSPEDAQKILNQGVPQIKDIDAKDYTQESLSRFLQSRNPADLVAAREMKIAQNGVVYDPYGVKPGAIYRDPNQPFFIGPDGRIVSNDPYQKYKKDVAQAGASRTNVNVDTAPKAFWNDFGKQASDQLYKDRESAVAANATLQGIGEIRNAVQSGAFQGAGADLKLGAAKALGSLGLQIAPEQVKNSEQFNAVANQFVLNSIKGLGANPSNADREFIEKTVPRLSTDPGALPLLLNFMEGKARTQVEGYNSKIRGVQRQPGASFLPYSLEVPTAQPAAARSASDPLGIRR